MCVRVTLLILCEGIASAAIQSFHYPASSSRSPRERPLRVDRCSTARNHPPTAACFAFLNACAMLRDGDLDRISRAIRLLTGSLQSRACGMLRHLSARMSIAPRYRSAQRTRTLTSMSMASHVACDLSYNPYMNPYSLSSFVRLHDYHI